MLEATGIGVRIGGKVVLDDVSITVPPASVTGLIGPNGAGKTTFFDVVTGMRRPSAGSVRCEGASLDGRAPHRRARAGLARTFQSLQLFGTLTTRQNIILGSRQRTRHEREAATEAILDRKGLSPVADTPAQLLPTGTGRRVELGRALAGEPRYLLLDEPASGQTERETEEFADLVAAIAADGVGVLLVEHDVPLVMRVCRLVHVLDFGRVLASGTPETIRADPAVQSAYLGTSAVGS
jgi:branched-chain amino acid transport system ATP-binding protein